MKKYERRKKEKLIKLLQENKDLPIVFAIKNDEMAADYGSTVCENYNAFVSEVYYDDEVAYFGADDVEDEYRDRLADNEETKSMTDNEFDKYVSNYVENNIKHYKAIVISCYP